MQYSSWLFILQLISAHDFETTKQLLVTNLVCGAPSVRSLHTASNRISGKMAQTSQVTTKSTQCWTVKQGSQRHTKDATKLETYNVHDVKKKTQKLNEIRDQQCAF